jgi:hypothetical protein
MPSNKTAPKKAPVKAPIGPQAPPDPLAAPKAPTERVQALRARRQALGLSRLDVYAHPDDHPAIKALADGLARNRGWK